MVFRESCTSHHDRINQVVSLCIAANTKGWLLPVAVSDALVSFTSCIEVGLRVACGLYDTFRVARL